MSDPRSDEALMLAYRAGDLRAFEALFGRWRGPLYRYLAHQCRNAADADELYQDIWLKVVNARLGYEVSAKFSTWIFRIAHNRLIDHYRAGGRRFEDPPPDLEADGDPFAAIAAPADAEPLRQLERKALAERLVAAVAELPAAQREAFLLAEEAGLGVGEIAAATGVGHETAKSRLRYAFARLRQSLRDLCDERS